MFLYERHTAQLSGDVNPHSKRETPQIGGSSAGFITLITGLIVVIIVSCVAVYILLRDHEPSEEERGFRRRRHGTFDYSSSSSPPDVSIKDRWNNLLSRFSIRRRKQGWTQPEDDDWDVDIGDDAPAPDPLSSSKQPPPPQMKSVDGEAPSLPAPLTIPMSTGTTYIPPVDSPRVPAPSPSIEQSPAPPSVFTTHSGEMHTQNGGTKFVEII